MTTRRALTRTPGGRLAAAALTAVLGVGLAGCQATSPLTTDILYDPADGVSASVDGVTVNDLLVISEAEGEPGQVSGLVTNAGSEPATVTVALEDRTELGSVEVEPGHSVRLDGEPVHGGEATDPVRVEQVGASPGQFLTLRVSVAGGATSAEVPVLPPTGPYDGFGSDQAGSTAGPDDADSTADPDH